jgi:hypothetical protein
MLHTIRVNGHEVRVATDNPAFHAINSLAHKTNQSRLGGAGVPMPGTNFFGKAKVQANRNALTRKMAGKRPARRIGNMPKPGAQVIVNDGRVSRGGQVVWDKIDRCYRVGELRYQRKDVESVTWIGNMPTVTLK